MQMTSKGGCGSGSCGCGATATVEPQSNTVSALAARAAADSAPCPPPALRAPPLPAQSPQPPELQGLKRINGIALFATGQMPPPEVVHDMAYTELLRQEAVNAGLLPRHKGPTAPDLTDAERQIVEDMIDGAVATPQPTAEECQRFFDANKAQFVVGQALHLRHILFAVTPGVNVQALATHAEKALLELLHKNAPDGRFEQLAAELSNCPTSTQGGDLGWVSPEDCAPELANELFHQNHAQRGNGVHTKLMHSRFGFHIMEVLGRREGEQKSYAEVQERIAAQLTLQSRSKALRQYMSLLVGQALVEGLDLEGADSPLVQ